MLECKIIDGHNGGSITNFPLHVAWNEPQVDTTEHLHSYTELVLILKGNSVHYCGETSVPVMQGDVLVVPPGIVHFYRNSSEDFSLVNIIFLSDQLPIPLIDVPLLPGFQAVFHGKSPGTKYTFLHLPEEDFLEIRKLVIALRYDDETRPSGYRFSMLGTFMMMLSRLARLHSHEQGRNPQIFLHINGVISYLNRHFKEPCPLSKLCQVANMSRATLQRNFLAATGTSPRQYQLQLRIAEAMTLLRTSDKTVDDIAEELGFGNRNYFSRQFHKITGKTPVHVKKNIEHF